MMKVRVSSESFGFRKPSIVYRSCHERTTAAIARAVRRGVLTKLDWKAWYDDTIHQQREKNTEKEGDLGWRTRNSLILANTMGMREERQKRQDEGDTESKRS